MTRADKLAQQFEIDEAECAAGIEGGSLFPPA